MAVDPLSETNTEQSPLQLGFAWILDALRRLGDAIRELPNTEREWPGGR